MPDPFGPPKHLEPSTSRSPPRLMGKTGFGAFCIAAPIPLGRFATAAQKSAPSCSCWKPLPTRNPAANVQSRSSPQRRHGRLSNVQRPTSNIRLPRPGGTPELSRGSACTQSLSRPGQELWRKAGRRWRNDAHVCGGLEARRTMSRTERPDPPQSLSRPGQELWRKAGRWWRNDAHVCGGLEARRTMSRSRRHENRCKNSTSTALVQPKPCSLVT